VKTSPSAPRPRIRPTEWRFIEAENYFKLCADTDRAGLSVHAKFDEIDGVLHLFSLEVYREQGDVIADDMRSVALSELHAAARELIQRGESDGHPDLYGPPPAMPPPGWLTDFETRPRPGRAGRDKRTMAEFAARYLEHCKGTKPIQTLAAELGMSPSAVSSRVFNARSDGYLTSTDKGRPGGELTPMAKELLDGAS
jgi:hypothetical protein